MKNLFLLISGVLIIASLYTWMTMADHRSNVPVIYWKSDANPQRYEQVDLFHQWLRDNNHVTPEGKPVVELRLDPGSRQSSVIHAVSGVGGDLIDTGVMTRFFYAMGVTEDLAPAAANGGYGLDNTYRGLEGALVFNGDQRAYLCNAAVANLWFNLDTLKKYGMDAPPEEWTPEEFEAYGKEFVKRANADNPKNRVFFGQSMAGNANFILCIARSNGLDFYNETMTRATIYNDVNINTFKLLYKWTYVDRLFPTATELESANVESGYGGVGFAMFLNGRYAMVNAGRYALIRFREFTRPINLHSAQYPMYEFKNMVITARSVIIYAGSRNKEYAGLFLEFLAGRRYNEYIIEGADGLPPNPRYAIGNPRYLSPSPNEGNVHAAELKWALECAYPGSESPYFNMMGTNWINNGMDKYFNNLCSAEDALKEAELRYNTGIADSIKANPELRTQWEKDVKDQTIIDECKAQGKKIPADLIKNPFYLAYYEARNMLE